MTSTAWNENFKSRMLAKAQNRKKVPKKFNVSFAANNFDVNSVLAANVIIKIKENYINARIFREIPPEIKEERQAKSHVVTSTMSNPFKKETRRRNWMNF